MCLLSRLELEVKTVGSPVKVELSRGEEPVWLWSRWLWSKSRLLLLVIVLRKTGGLVLVVEALVEVLLGWGRVVVDGSSASAVILVLVRELVKLWSVLTVIISTGDGWVALSWSGWLLVLDGVVLWGRVVLWRSTVLLWPWLMMMGCRASCWKWSRGLWQMVTRDLETILACGVVNSDFLSIGVDVGVLSLPLPILSSLFLELYSILLDVSSPKTSIPLKVSGFSQNGGSLGVNVSLGRRCHCYDEKEGDRVHFLCRK